MFGLVILGFWGVVVLAEKVHVCPRPMPDDHFPWAQCSVPCAWCDHMVRWLKEEAPPEGPYRSKPRID